MRFLDIAVAVMIGVSAVSSIAVWTPRSGDALSDRIALQTQLRDKLVAFVKNRGLPWLLHASPAEVCAAMASSVTPPASVFASMGGQSCGAPPPGGAVVSNLTLPLLPFEVTLVAWSGA